MRRGVGLAVALVLAGCASQVTPSSLTETPMTTPSASEAMDVRVLGAAGEELEPGRYTRDDFDPRVTFEVGEGWTAEQVADGLFDVQQDVGSPHVIAVQFARPVGPATALEIANRLAADQALAVSEPERVTVGRLDAIRLVVETTDPIETQPPIFREVLTVPAGPISIASGRRLQVTLLDTPDGVLAILVGGSIANWPITLDIARPVVDSVTIGD